MILEYRFSAHAEVDTLYRLYYAKSTSRRYALRAIRCEQERTVGLSDGITARFGPKWEQVPDGVGARRSHMMYQTMGKCTRETTAISLSCGCCIGRFNAVEGESEQRVS